MSVSRDLLDIIEHNARWRVSPGGDLHRTVQRLIDARRGKQQPSKIRMWSVRPDLSWTGLWALGVGQLSNADHNCRRAVELDSPNDSALGSCCLSTRFCSKPFLAQTSIRSALVPASTFE